MLPRGDHVDQEDGRRPHGARDRRRQVERLAHGHRAAKEPLPSGGSLRNLVQIALYSTILTDLCAILAIALRALINEKADAGATLTGPSGTQRYGVFIDFCSLFQHPDPSAGVFRTPEEDARFKLALSTLSALYSALGTNVLRLTVLPKDYPNGYELPEGSNIAQYDDRGWCYTEGRWAALTKPATATFDLGRLSDLEGKTILLRIDFSTRRSD